MRAPLTGEQLNAAGSGASRLFSEASPGSGKTTVAVERFGVLRFGRTSRSSRSILTLSFARSATAELDARIRRRWGSCALTWPHSVSTIDAPIRNVVHYLLGTGVVRWPGDHKTLDVLDDWRGHAGYRWLRAGHNYRRVVTLDAHAMVSSISQQVVTASFGFGSKEKFHAQLECGRCTHVEVRAVLTAVLDRTELRQEVARYLARTVDHVIVDEIFDANNLDLAVVELCCEMSIGATIIGDPWQALYEFRGAQPQLVRALVADRKFTTLPLSGSFRFKTEMRSIAKALRSSMPVTICAGGPYDVVLALKWESLWECPAHVLPMSFGPITNRTDAAVVLLLNHILVSRLMTRASCLHEALVLLGIKQEALDGRGQEVMETVVDVLARAEPVSPQRALNDLRDAVKELGARRRPPSGKPEAKAQQVDRLAAIALRIASGERLVPGMTPHQAKGREWDNVGVCLTASELKRLRAGLRQDCEADRCVYVALTRARRGITRVDRVAGAAS